MNGSLLKVVFYYKINFFKILNKKEFPLYNNVIYSHLFRFYCNKTSDSESDLKKLLNNASPLKNTDLKNSWISSPYPEGTVFRESELNEKLGNTSNKSHSVIMFPGQGNQFVGMCNNLMKYPVVKDMFDAAKEILNYDLLKICTQGPAEKLNKTEYCQAAMLIASLGALEKLKDEKPWALNNCTTTCGFSVGELAALVFAGCLTFEKAMKLIKIRSEAMQLCCKANPGGMMTVLYGPDSSLSLAIQDAIQNCKLNGMENAHCSVANYLFPSCKVIAGHVEALNYIIENKDKYRLKRFSKLPVSGAFHTPLMSEAAEIFKEALKNVDVKDPIIKVYSNVNARPYRNKLDIKLKLPKQICYSVKWEQIMHSIFERKLGRDFPYSYECGPGKSLITILGKINNKAAQYCTNIGL